MGLGFWEWILIGKWGINGAAVAWLIRVSIDMILLFWASARVGKIRFSYLAGNGVAIVFISLMILGLVGYFAVQFPLRIFSIIAFVIIFLCITWLYGLDGVEREWTKSKFRFIFGKI